MAEKKYIEVEAAIETIKSLYPSVPFIKLNIDKWHEKNKAYMECEMAIEAIPAADVREVVRGKWQKCLISADRQYDTKGMSQIIEGYVCDACNNFSVSMYRYCPNCGADMREES